MSRIDEGLASGNEMPPNTRIRKIVSGGQTGVDRAALNVAIFLDIEHGGWCPKGRRAEDGPIPSMYELNENSSTDYAVRTEQNVIESDATLIVHFEKLKGGTALTARLAKRHKRPLLVVDLAGEADPGSVLVFANENNVMVLNVAGPRESSRPGIEKEAEQFLLAALTG